MLTEEVLRLVIQEEVGPRLDSLEGRFDSLDQRIKEGFEAVDQRFKELLKALAGVVDEKFPVIGQRSGGSPATGRIAAKGS